MFLNDVRDPLILGWPIIAISHRCKFVYFEMLPWHPSRKLIKPSIINFLYWVRYFYIGMTISAPRHAGSHYNLLHPAIIDYGIDTFITRESITSLQRIKTAPRNEDSINISLNRTDFIFREIIMDVIHHSHLMVKISFCSLTAHALHIKIAKEHT
jgi:hypothetical protein